MAIGPNFHSQLQWIDSAWPRSVSFMNTSMRRSALSKPGTLREGFEYQDLYGIGVALSWLEHPNNFLWVRFEAEEFGSLDDIAILDSDNNLRLVQVKHVTERPDRPGLSLDDLLEKKGTRGRSLFEKWFRSWLSVVDDSAYNSIQVVVHTNRPPADDLAGTLAGEDLRNIDPAVLREKNSEIVQAMEVQTDAASGRLDAFLRTLTFRFESADIEPAEEVLQQRANALNLTREGFSSLCDQIWDWSTHRTESGETPEIVLSDIKRACGWRRAEKLDETFPVASDYVPLGGDLVEAFATNILSKPSGEFILSDVPGAGKSTFLAKLSEHLSEQNIPCVRHHYFLGRNDASIYDRLNAKRTADALVAEMEVFTDVPVNPSVDKFRQILDSVSASLQREGRRLVLLLDGLDHVLRTEDEEELALILKQILPPPSGCSVVLGTRLLPSQRVRALLEHIPFDQRFEVPRMTVDDCIAILRAHSAINVPEHSVESVARRLQEITEGLPLHAHYCLTQLEVATERNFVLESSLDQLIPYGGDLVKYYDEIWQTFSAETKILAIVLAVAEFPVPQQAMPLLFHGTSTDLQRALENLRPFVNESSDGITLFHASFLEFVADHADTTIYRSSSLERLVQWLGSHASPYLRWRWLNVKRLETGDPQPLIDTTTREWVIDSLCEALPSDAIEELLRLACHATMKRGDYATAFEKGSQADQIEYSLRGDDDVWVRALSLASLHQADSTIGDINVLDFLNQNGEVLIDLIRRTPPEGLPLISGELFTRFESVVRAEKLQNHREEISRAARLYVGALAQAREQLETVVGFLQRFNSEPMRTTASIDYFEALVVSKQFANARTAIDALPVADSERARLRERLALAGFSPRALFSASDVGQGLWGQLYGRVVLHEVTQPKYSWPQAADLPSSIDRFQDDQRTKLATGLHSAWLNGLLAGASSDPSVLSSWKSERRPPGWTSKTAVIFGSIGFDMGVSLVEGSGELCVSLARLAEIEVMTPGDPSWEEYELWISYKKALQHILSDLLRVRFTWQQKRLDQQALDQITSIPEFIEYDQFKLILSCSPEILVRGILVSFVQGRLDSLRTRLEQFPERAEAYLDIAILARRVGDRALSQTCLRKAIDNLLGYGNHKDPFFYELLRALELSIDCGLRELEPLLDLIAPVANVIDRVTDGDGTGSTLEDFAGITLLAGSSETASAIYRTVFDEERYYQADGVFEAIAKFGDLSNVWVHALLRSATDSASRYEIAKRKGSDPIAEYLMAQMMAEDHDPILRPKESDDNTSGQASRDRLLDGLIESDVRSMDPSSVVPADFHAFCEEHRTDYYLVDFAQKWLEVWSQSEQEQSYRAIKGVLSARLVRSWSGDMELRLLPLTLEFDGPSQAFQALITAAQRIYVWNAQYTQPEKTETVFSFLFDHFPDRIEEFIQKTLESPGYRKRMGYLPVRRGVQFLLASTRPEDAMRLLGSAVDRLISLMANLELPTNDWSRKEEHIIDALFSRLFHVHPEVRSRAARSIGNLLLDTATSPRIRAALESKLADCQLESEFVTLAYPVAFATKRGYEWPRDELLALCKVRSTALELVLQSVEG